MLFEGTFPMTKLLVVFAVLIGGLVAAGAVFNMSGKSCAVTDVAITEVALGCCGLPKPCPDCQCDEAACEDACGDAGSCCGDKAACDEVAAACCGGAGDACCGQCEDKAAACAERKACGEAAAEKCAGEKELAKCCKEQEKVAEASDAPAKSCCSGGE
jgi:hypothetical protein